MSAALDVVELFVRQEKRERLRALLAKSNRRSDFCDALLHDRRNLDASVLMPLDPHGLTLGHIVQTVGAPRDSAHCIGGEGLRDGVDGSLVDLIANEAFHTRDVLVFDVTTRRAYYENHEGEKFVLRPAGG